MGSIISTYIFPHPPIIIPEVGKGEESDAAKTINAACRAAEIIAEERPTTIIVTTPHGPVFQDYIYMSTSLKLAGDFGKFGCKNVKLDFVNNVDLVNRITEHAKQDGIYSGGLDDSIARKYNISRELDHGAMVPLYFITKAYNNFKLVHISIAGITAYELYKFGICISKAVQESDEQVVFVASGDLSHKLSSNAPYGYNKRGREFDELLIESLKKIDVEQLLYMDEGLCESAGECGLRSFIIMFGGLDGYDIKPEVLSYEGPYGVGYAVARFGVGEKCPDRQILKKLEVDEVKKINAVRANEDPYVRLARKALETYVRENRIIKPPDGLPSSMLENSAGTFVSIKKQGQLRGCIGTIVPTRDSVAEEIIYNAISSGTRDPRFDSVEEDELNKLVYSVDVLKEPEPIKTIAELDVIKYGVIVKAGHRSGLLLPNLEGVDTPEKQVSIALQKAGIKPDEKYSMERFEVIRHK